MRSDAIAALVVAASVALAAGAAARTRHLAPAQSAHARIPWPALRSADQQPPTGQLPPAGQQLPAGQQPPAGRQSLAALQPPPVALLYIDRHCRHCQYSARLFDSLSTALHTRTLLVSNDPSDSAAAVARYAAALGLHQEIALDTTRALARAAQLRAVPALIFVTDDRVDDVIYGTPPAATLAADLRAARDHGR